MMMLLLLLIILLISVRLLSPLIDVEVDEVTTQQRGQHVVREKPT